MQTVTVVPNDFISLKVILTFQVSAHQIQLPPNIILRYGHIHLQPFEREKECFIEVTS